MTSLVQVTELRCEYLTDPLGIDVRYPRLSWILQSERRNVLQSAYQILVASQAALLAQDQGDIWDSGRVTSRQNMHVVYAGPPLRTGQRLWWKVRIWDEQAQVSAYSEPACWEMGLLEPADWQAQWITLPLARELPPPEGKDGLLPGTYLRKSVSLERRPQRARLYVTARGLYEAFINGQRIGQSYLTPGWTDYYQRIQYQIYDVTDLLQIGENILGALLGTGWYCGYVGWLETCRHYGTHPALLWQLQLAYEDGSTQTIVSDHSWRGSTGPMRYSDLLMGEYYDARLEFEEPWTQPAFVAQNWSMVEVDPLDQTLLVADCAQPILVTEELHPRQIISQQDGHILVDMGQNMVGWVRLRVQGASGTLIQLHFGEMLNADGTLHTANLRSARQTDTYIVKGSAEPEFFEPHFTFHGFRYVEISGYPGELTPESLVGRVVHSAIPLRNTFTSSSSLVNQIVQNTLWSQRGNFLSVPTDCPQRDERLGWMGDAQIFVGTACYNAEVAAFFTKWMRDVVDAQSAEGGFSDVAPRLIDWHDAAPAWGDAGIIVPWTLYRMYGDTRLLEEHYEAMTRWLAYIQRANSDLLWTRRLNNNYGDWLAIEAETPKEVLATAFFAYDAHLLAEIARVLGRQADAMRYTQLFEDIKAAFQRAYVSPDGVIQGETQTCYVLALYMELLPEELRPLAVQHLVADLEKRHWRLSTGFVGVSYLCPVLSRYGYNDLAYRLLLSEDFPSWGYSIKQGATTIWERWDGWTEREGFKAHHMNSFNHYSLGSIVQWLYQYVAGIELDLSEREQPRCVLHPRPGVGLRAIDACYHSPCGLIRCQWEQMPGQTTVALTIPPNMTATVILPLTSSSTVLLDDQPVEYIVHRVDQGTEQRVQEATFQLGSGSYTFSVSQASSGAGEP
jgi:alpha-L-rhamnosidase